MLRPIKVRPRDRRDRMEPMSRVNFGKIYTVEHNVKVYDFGDVERNDLHRLRSQWKDVLRQEWEDETDDEDTIPEENEGETEEEDDGGYAGYEQ